MVGLLWGAGGVWSWCSFSLSYGNRSLCGDNSDRGEMICGGDGRCWD